MWLFGSGWSSRDGRLGIGRLTSSQNRPEEDGPERRRSKPLQYKGERNEEPPRLPLSDSLGHGAPKAGNVITARKLDICPAIALLLASPALVGVLLVPLRIGPVITVGSPVTCRRTARPPAR